MGFFDRFKSEKSSIDAYVGGSKEDTSKVRARLEANFKNQDLEKFKPFERPKSPDELRLIEMANAETDRIRESFGLPPYELPAANFHILRKEAEKLLEGATAYVIPMRQTIAILETDTLTEMLQHIMHELMHAKSYQSVEVAGDDSEMRRVGLSGTSKKMLNQHAFRALNEAVTQELTKRSMRLLEDELILAKETPMLRDARKEFGDDVSYADVLEKHANGGMTVGFRYNSYKDERKALDQLIDKLADRHPDGKKPREEWFDVFASAMFNGHLLEIARAVEKTFGKGVFERLWSENDGAKLLATVESL